MAREDLRFFLENQLRRSDILFEAHDGGWVLFATTPRDGVFELLERLQQAHARANQTRPLQPIVGFDPAYVGTWSSDGQRLELARTFRSLLATRASEHAFQ